MKIIRKSTVQCWRLPALASACLLVIACASPPRSPAYQAETFTSESPFQYYSDHEPATACEFGKRALLSQGYQLDTALASAQPAMVRGEKYFLPDPDRATKLAITLICLPSSLGAVVYANAMETHFELKSRGSSAGVSVSGLGSLSLPWAADKDTLVKVGEVTITAPEFYRRLFDLIKTLDN